MRREINIALCGEDVDVTSRGGSTLGIQAVGMLVCSEPFEGMLARRASKIKAETTMGGKRTPVRKPESIQGLEI
jgi:hypothetical protein